MAAVEITDATKSFGETVAVNGLSLQVPEGSIYGFIGPNGSGKTTTLRMIMRILHPDRGRIHVLGEDVTESSAASERVGYLPEERGLYRKMVVKDLLRFYAELKGLRDSNRAIDQWLERLDLAEWGDKKVESLSKGMSQKLQFIATVLHKPQLILLDEPFSGLDPVNMDVLRQAVLDLRRDGATVIFSTHDMGVAEKMCDFIFMIYKGRKVLDGTLASIRDQYSNDTLRVRLSENGEVVNRLDGIEKVNDYGQFKELRMTAGADAQKILQQLAKQCRVEHFEITQPSLHDVFVRIAGPEAEEAQHA